MEIGGKDTGRTGKEGLHDQHHALWWRYPAGFAGRVNSLIQIKKTLVHVFHAFDDLTCYHKGSLDNYDAVMLVGPFEIPILRQLEQLRALPEKELYPAGLPYLDEVYEKRNLKRRKHFSGCL